MIWFLSFSLCNSKWDARAGLKVDPKGRFQGYERIMHNTFVDMQNYASVKTLRIYDIKNEP